MNNTRFDNADRSKARRGEATGVTLYKGRVEDSPDTYVPRKSQECYNCSGKGHFQARCPQPPRDPNRKPGLTRRQRRVQAAQEAKAKAEDAWSEDGDLSEAPSENA